MKPIISNFFAGWLLFQVDSYSCCASYLNSTPTELEKYKNKLTQAISSLENNLKKE